MGRVPRLSKEEIVKDLHQCGKRNKGRAALASKAKECILILRYPSNSCLPAARIDEENGILRRTPQLMPIR
ncbi:hypothetical protein AVEN_155927-1 [Araneus ventricosus]|uniref:Uncharacterized protein n=1 Tax=Araneus ventricosus TaxID=182803 RepID=A0A4Y2M1V2_ARAVE|nr:hypothetical protein AVEN_155927-1 [Araneus ventricosus]